MYQWKRMGCIMSKCVSCHVTILDKTDYCPLCHQVLEHGDGAYKQLYPDARIATRKFRLFENIVLFLSIVAEIIGIYVDWTMTEQLDWSLILGLILIYANVLLRLAIIGKSGYISKTVNMLILALAILFGIDYLTGYKGWALTYAFPVGIILMDLAILILMIVNRRNWQSYMMLQIFTMVLSAGGLILLAMGLLASSYVILVAAAASLFLFLGTLIIGDRRARNELKRRFHI